VVRRVHEALDTLKAYLEETGDHDDGEDEYTERFKPRNTG
jgi:hypothetical protein